jgi:uncharacterized membrane protein YoaK (UPF0700 family)
MCCYGYCGNIPTLFLASISCITNIIYPIYIANEITNFPKSLEFIFGPQNEIRKISLFSFVLLFFSFVLVLFPVYLFTRELRKKKESKTRQSYIIILRILQYTYFIFAIGGTILSMFFAKTGTLISVINLIDEQFVIKCKSSLEKVDLTSRIEDLEIGGQDKNE